jgi:chemotaxis protein MotB
MGKRQIDPPDEEELWLTSYADMMTLIACFFILMMAFANYEEPGFQKKVQIIAEHFKKNQGKGEGKGEFKGDGKESDLKMKFFEDELARHPDIKKMVKVSMKDGDLNVVFQGSALFTEQSAELDENIEKSLDSMVSIIRSLDPNYRILIEGHTDNIPPQADSGFVNNWALSSARAAAVVERFEIGGFEPSKLAVVGYADTRPIAPMMDSTGKPLPENQKLNRRVVIKVIAPREDKKPIKMGLGVYFNDSTEPITDLP